MYKNKTILSIYKDLNFITVILLFVVNKKRIKNIDSIYYLRYGTGNPSKNIIKDSSSLFKNYFLFLNYDLKKSDDIILLNDKLFLLSHITLLRNIARKKKNCWYIIVDNMVNNSTINNSFKSPILKYIKCFEITTYECHGKFISFYALNKLCAKILIFSYIICINKLYG